MIKLISSCPELRSKTSVSPVTFLEEELSQNLAKSKTELRIGISIFFHFIRKPSLENIFLNHIKIWQQQLVAALLRIANWEDHLYLIYNVLRCPNGTAKWASQFIQVPNFDYYCDSFSDAKVNYCLTLIGILMSPIKDRDKFLKQLINDCMENVVDAARTDSVAWTFIDSDGEEDILDTGEIRGLKENDVVMLLNQIPLENMLG